MFHPSRGQIGSVSGPGHQELARPTERSSRKEDATAAARMRMLEQN